MARQVCVGCGESMMEHAIACPKCGRKPLPAATPEPGAGWKVLGLLLVGLVVWGLFRDKPPKADPLRYTAAEMAVDDGVLVMVDALVEAEDCDALRGSLRAPVTRGHNAKYTDFVFAKMEQAGCYR